MEKSFIAHPWIQRSVVGLEEYSPHDWRAATSDTARSSYLARVGPVARIISLRRVLEPNSGRSHGSADTLPLRHSANIVNINE